MELTSRSLSKTARQRFSIANRWTSGTIETTCCADVAMRTISLSTAVRLAARSILSFRAGRIIEAYRFHFWTCQRILYPLTGDWGRPTSPVSEMILPPVSWLMTAFGSLIWLPDLRNTFFSSRNRRRNA